MNRPEVGRVIPNAPVGLRQSGNPVPQRRHLSHVAPNWVPAGEIYLITICCTKRTVNQLAEPKVFNTMVAALEHSSIAEKIWVTLFLAVPDHLHLLASFPRQIDLAKIVRDWKRFVAKQAGILWQDGFFDHRLRSKESFEEKSCYIRLNPVRAGLVSTADRWNYVWPDCNVSPAR